MSAEHALPDSAEDFEKHIRPLLLSRCVECHGPAKQEQRLRLDRRQDVMAASFDGLALVKPGDPGSSRMLQVLQHTADDVQMPPDGKLSDQEISVISQWITDGAIWPESSTLESDALARSQQWRSHWAFQRPVRPEPAALAGSPHPIDSLIQQQLSEKQLRPSPAADLRTLTRRLAFALTGLPPEPADYESAAIALDAGNSEQWLSELVDRLLTSPHFGERWGRYWLDTARYADTKGYVFTEDREYRDAWRFRVWVIQALNSDMPYDEFLRRQLAADRMPGSDDAAQLAAMGFLTLGRRFLNNRHDIIDDRIDVTIRGMIGLTAACARCHDHKFDPIPSADYYSLYGIFDSSDEPGNEPSSLRLVDREKPVSPVIFVRGQPANRGPVVPRRFLTALSPPDTPEFSVGSGRLELANAIASRENPLTARVAVNRAWMHLFGRGLVDTPSDFGLRTPEPIQRQLLDYLAVYFMDHGWSNRSLIRHIVTSETWQQSSDRRQDAESSDPENRLLSRMNRLRLDFEAHRDAILAVSGSLDRTIGGMSFDVVSSDAPPRRTVYARIDRQNLPGIFRTFDLANPDTHSPNRFETTVPQQALFQLNNGFMMKQAEQVSDRVKSVSTDPMIQADLIFRQVLLRPPATEELTAATVFLTVKTESPSHSEATNAVPNPAVVDASAQLAQILMLTNEFVFVD